MNQKQKFFKYYYKYFKNGLIIKNLISSIVRFFLKKDKIKSFIFFEQTFYSQNGEDGIIKAIFDKIGTTNKFCVEFGIQPIEGNTIYLKKKGWNFLWMDKNGDEKLIKKEFVTPENINSLFKKYKILETFDLLSIDIDGNDYWVWKAITGYSPRVVVIEYNASIPPSENKIVKYDPKFCWDGADYFGASLLALEKLGKLKGYTLIACNKKGVNAFFIRTDLMKDNFKVKKITEIYNPPKFGIKVNGKYIGPHPSDKSMVSV